MVAPMRRLHRAEPMRLLVGSAIATDIAEAENRLVGRLAASADRIQGFPIGVDIISIRNASYLTWSGHRSSDDRRRLPLVLR